MDCTFSSTMKPALQAGGRRFESCTAHHTQTIQYVTNGDFKSQGPLTPCFGGTVLQRFEQFIKERQYIINVSPSTIE